MRLVHRSGDGWGLLEDGGRVRFVAGPLSGWGPRIACGEGLWALPLTGRTARWDELHDASLDSGLRRILSAGVLPTGVPGLAAVLGAPLTGRRNPFRSVCGYVGARVKADVLKLGAVLVTRDEFGDSAPEPISLSLSGSSDLAERLQAVDREHALGAGDVVLLGPVRVREVLRGALWPEPAFEGCLGPAPDPTGPPFPRSAGAGGVV